MASDLKPIEFRIGRIVDAIERGADVGPLRERLLELEQKRLALKHALVDASGGDAVIHIHPDLSDLYKA